MINPKEIRIGNYFKDELTGEWLMVDEITKADNGDHVIGFFVVNRKKYPLPAGWKAVPVELNTELVEKVCGFERKIDGLAIELPYDENNHDDNYSLYMSYGSNRFFICGTKENSGYGGFEIKYLHDLQNMFSSYSNGKELEINL